MKISPLEIKGNWKATPETHSDHRGFFREWFKKSEILEITGQNFDVSQANISTSQTGVLRGIHFSSAPEGQAKWVTCMAGAILDVIVDLRPESETYRQWTSVELNSENGEAIFVDERMGHAFLSLQDSTTVAYLLSSLYQPEFEYGINPFDLSLGIKWPSSGLILSDKDQNAPTLEMHVRMGHVK